MKTILCYGDSNTWGFVPGSIDFETMYMERYPRDVRWTGRLQHALGDDYYVCENGLNGRTTNLDYPDIEGRNGKTFLISSLYAASPIDLVILMIGGNDLKKMFNRSTQDISNATEELICMIKECKYGADMQAAPEILLIGYPEIVNETYFEDMLEGAIEKSKQFDKYYSELAKKHNCHYFNAAPHLELSAIDGIHFDEKAHVVFAELMTKKVQEIFNS